MKPRGRVKWVGIGIALLLCSACQLSVLTTATYQPATLLSITPTPSPTPVPAPSLNEVTLELKLDLPASQRGQVPADGRTQVSVNAQLSAPDGISLDGLQVFFTAYGGGSFEQAYATAIDGIAQTLYTAGESPDTSQVRIVATADLPHLGRVAGETRLTLVRQNLSVSLAQRPDSSDSGDPAGIPLTITLSADRLDTWGSYPVRITVDTQSNGVLTAENTSRIGRLIDISMRVGILQTVYFVPPSDTPSGAASICVEIPDRPQESPTCAPVQWAQSPNSL